MRKKPENIVGYCVVLDGGFGVGSVSSSVAIVFLSLFYSNLDCSVEVEEFLPLIVLLDLNSNITVCVQQFPVVPVT